MTQNLQPLVSVCIPVYNCESFIGQAIQSVLDQTYQNFELLIIDNASTDKTCEVIESFHDPRIKYLKNTGNLGMMANWNRVLVESTGRYIKLLPADDLIYANCIENQVSAFEQADFPNIALVCCSRDIIDINGKILITRSYSGGKGFIQGARAVRQIVKSGTNKLGEPGAILFRKDLLADHLRFSNQFPYVIDLSLWIKLLTKGDLFVIQERLCAFRVSPQSESVNSRHSHRDDFSKYIKTLDKKTYDLSKLDIFIGLFNSMLLEYLRRVFYILTKVNNWLKK
jgi:glycosyltransferase involved in cell wall biosynthesis